MEQGIDADLKQHYTDVLAPASADKLLKIKDFLPFHAHILVKPIPPDTQIGKIILPPKAQEKKAVGWVMAVPEARAWESLIAKGDKAVGPFVAGDIVLYAKDSGDDVIIEGEEFTILRWSPTTGEGDILGKWPVDKLPAEVQNK